MPETLEPEIIKQHLVPPLVLHRAPAWGPVTANEPEESLLKKRCNSFNAADVAPKGRLLTSDYEHILIYRRPFRGFLRG